jgi:hypothetical protein
MIYVLYIIFSGLYFVKWNNLIQDSDYIVNCSKNSLTELLNLIKSL